MKAEYWEFIGNNWGKPAEEVEAEIAKMRNEDQVEANNLSAKISEQEKQIQQLTTQNIDLNKTNMNLILRLTDPNTAVMQQDDYTDDYKAPSINDLDKFVKEG